LLSFSAGFITLWYVWDYLGGYESACAAFLAAPLWLMVIFASGFYLLFGASAAFMLEGRLNYRERAAALARWAVIMLLTFCQAGLFLRAEYYRLSFAAGALVFFLCLSAVPSFARSGRMAGLCLLPCCSWLLYLACLGFYVAVNL
jgi:tryptophan-rich sensory protein